jgi:hypothetical protein
LAERRSFFVLDPFYPSFFAKKTKRRGARDLVATTTNCSRALSREMTRRAAAACAVACLLMSAAAAAAATPPTSRHLLRRSSTTSTDLPAETDAPPPPPPPPGAPPSPRDAAGSSHPLTAHVEYQLQGMNSTTTRLVRALVSQALKSLGEAVHMPGPTPALLLLPRSCAVLQQWRRNGRETGPAECITVRARARARRALSRTAHAHHAPGHTARFACHCARPASRGD